MNPSSAGKRVRALFGRNGSSQNYEPILEASEDEDVQDSILVSTTKNGEEPFSWIEYFVFLLLGVAMLWAWNMFLSAAPYFQSRFRDNEKILAHFQPAITSVSCVTNLSSLLILSNIQAKANYPKRILASLVVNIVVFSLLSISTLYFRDVSSAKYLSFTLLMVFATSIATGLCQNGVFAFASSFGRPEYIQAIMTGQGISGVLPVVAQIVSVFATSPGRPGNEKFESSIVDDNNARSAFIYFLLAAVLSTITIIAVLSLMNKHTDLATDNMIDSFTSVEGVARGSRRVVGFFRLYQKLYFSAAGIYVCFAATMFFPVFTQKILSIVPSERAPRMFLPSVFIPLGFLVWNLGDLSGRLFTILPFYRRPPPAASLVFSLLRLSFIPMYLLCNINGHGAVINSDLFYLGVVQLLFGFTNGWLGSSCMMGVTDFVDEEEREAAGTFMATNLVAGLTTGSLLSFAVAGVQGFKG